LGWHLRPSKKVVLGGVSIDGETFDNDFKITKVKKDNAMDTLKYCAGLFVEYDKITMSFNELKNTYEELCSTEALIQSCEE
jgi:hypothetical protein